MPKPNRPTAGDLKDSSSKLNRLRTCLQVVADGLEAAIAAEKDDAKGAESRPVSAGGDMLLHLARLSQPETVKSACRWLWELDHGPDAQALWESWLDVESDMGEALAVILSKSGTPEELIAEIHEGPIPSEKLHGVLHLSIRGAAMHMLGLVQTLRRHFEAQAEKDVPSNSGNWLRPMSLADMSNRLGNCGRRKVRTMLEPYGLKQAGNRQSWTCRLDDMPPNMVHDLTK